jgi:hypothetical protein
MDKKKFLISSPP